MSATAVSACLRRAGFRPVSPSNHDREGLKVRRSLLGVRVVADLDDTGAAVAMATDAAEVLRETGWVVVQDAAMLTVTRPDAAL